MLTEQVEAKLVQQKREREEQDVEELEYQAAEQGQAPPEAIHGSST